MKINYKTKFNFSFNNIYLLFKVFNYKYQIIKERKFEILQSHTVSLKDHLHFNDDRPVFFMKSRKLDEVHIKRNEHNDKYHLEWFN